MKYGLPILFLIFIFIVGGCIDENSGNQVKIGGNDLFHLGMTIEEVRKVLNENKIEIINEIENAGDPETWDWGNKAIWTEGFNFSFDQDYMLYEVEYMNGEPAAQGVKVGDNIERLKEVYGEKYKLYSSEELVNMGMIEDSETNEVYEYLIDDHYFRADVVDQRIVSWEMSKYKLGTNSPVTEDYNEVVRKQENPIKTKLYEDFKHYMKMVHSDRQSELNRITASDRARGLLSLSKSGLFELTDEEFKQIRGGVDELRESLNDSIVYSGFLTYLSELSGERTLMVGLDLMVENMSDLDKEVMLNEIVVANPDGDSPVTTFSQENLSDALSKFNRAKMINNSMENGVWYAFVFDGTLIYDPTITVHLNDEEIILKKQ